MAIELDWQSMAETDLGVGLENWRALSGGDFARSYAASVVSDGRAAKNDSQLVAGAPLFIKTHLNPPPRHFSTEALGLAWLAETGTVRVPKVLGVSDDVPYLAIAWVDDSGRHRSDEKGEAELGRQLAALHQSPCSAFGREDNRSTGSLGLPNELCERWCDFYATQRLLPLAKIAADRQALSSKTISAIESVANKLDQWESPSLDPSRLHGDLWAGNRLVDSNGDSWVIDPASHGGHREFDLAMMRLFGGYGNDCFAAYQEAYPLDAGWQERIALHQLAPLIVHAIKFGHTYVGPTDEALANYT